MQEKEKLSVDECKEVDEKKSDIVSNIDSSSLYVDDKWFETKMKENKDGNSNTDEKGFFITIANWFGIANKEVKTYPVEIKAIKIRWIILSKYGKAFLTNILNNENLELYNISTLRIIIEYLYKQYNVFVYQKDLPVLLIKALLFMITVMLNEEHNTAH